MVRSIRVRLYSLMQRQSAGARRWFLPKHVLHWTDKPGPVFLATDALATGAWFEAENE